MDPAAFLIIIFFTSFTGWFISWMVIKILFWPVKPIHIAGTRLQGVIPAKQRFLAEKFGVGIQSAFHDYKGLDEKLADPSLLLKLRPEIEIHIDHFLKEKLKTVFPLLAQFIGDKTMSQFKAAFLTEIDNLLPVLIKNYMTELKNEIKLDCIISDKINVLSIETVKDIFHKNMKSEIRYFSAACTVIGLLSGIIISATLFLFNY